MKMSLLAMLIFCLTIQPALALTEEECKETVEKELYVRGLVNNRVCLNTNNYPNISINTNISDIESGKSNKPLKPEDIKAMSGLENLLNGALKDVKDARKEVVGYTDGEIAVFPSHDNKFFKTVGNKTPEDFEKSQNAGASYTMELDVAKVKTYVAEIKDPATKQKLEQLVANMKSNSVSFKKKGAGDKAEYHPSGDNQLIVDLLRNHALSIQRTIDFCAKTGNPAECEKNKIGVTSVDLLEKSQSETDAKYSSYHGQCGGRRGVSYNFYFPDELKKTTEHDKGVMQPSFNIPGREMQNNMQLAAAMDFMGKIHADSKTFGEFEAKNVKTLEKSPLFNDYDGDRKRFEQMLAKTNPECAKNQYQVDNQRRLYWAMAREFADAKVVLAADKTAKKADYENMISLMKEGNFAELKKNPEFNTVYELATKPKSHEANYLEEIKDELNLSKKMTDAQQKRLSDLKFIKNKGHMDGSPISKEEQIELDALLAQSSAPGFVMDKSLAQMVVLMRTMVVGRPVNHDNLSGRLTNSGENESEFLKYDGTIRSATYESILNADIRYKKDISTPEQKRYSQNGELSRLEDVGYPPADVYACHDVSDALVEDMQKNKTKLVSGLGSTGEETADANRIEKVYFDHAAVKEFDTNTSAVGLHQEKFRDWSKLQQAGFLENGSVIDNGNGNAKIHAKGWICQECGSGIHVHADGSVHPVSRQRIEMGQTSDVANQTFDVSKGDNFSMSGLQHLKVYLLKDCSNCDCVEGFKNGDDFKSKLASSGEIHNMVTYDANNQPVIDQSKNEFKIEDPKSCMYVAPVPHSCNYDPKGESPEKKEYKEIRENLYCKLRELILGPEPKVVNGVKEVVPETEFSKSNPRQAHLKDSDVGNVMLNCQRSVFPESEKSCLERFEKKGQVTTETKPQSVLEGQ